MKSARRVLFMIPSVNDGGMARSTKALARGFSRRGWDVVLVTLVPVDRPEELASVRLRGVGEGRTSLAAWRVWRTLREERPDLVVTASTQMGLLGLVCVKFGFCPAQIIVTERSMPLWLMRNFPTLKRWLVKVGQQTCYRWADRIVAISQAVANELGSMAGIPRDRIVVIENITFEPEMAAAASQAPTHPWLFEKHTSVVVALGHLEVRKGFDTLVRAFETVTKQTKARLIIFGEGGERLRLEGLVSSLELSERVSLPGAVANPFAEIARANLVVSAAVEEGAGRTVCEAMCLGVPVVAANAEGGIAEMLGNGRYGRLVPVSDPQALAGAIVDTLRENRAGQSNLGAERFREDVIIDRWEALLGEIEREARIEVS